MIYRFVVSHLAGTIACLFLCASYLTGRMIDIALFPDNNGHLRTRLGYRFFSSRYFWLVSFCLMLAGGLLVLPSFLELVRTGATYEHWSRFIAMSFMWSAAFILILTRVSDYTLELLEAQLAFMKTRARAVQERTGLRTPAVTP